MIHGLDANGFRAHTTEHLDKPVQREALQRATALIGGRRRLAVQAMPEWEELREHARAIKDEVLGSLDVYLERFEENATRAGVKVHWASTAEEACAVITDLARASGGGAIVKGKSMVTEEIGLNHALEELGYAPLETDLGERIIQLAGQTPAHIIAPAIHLTRADIAEIFVRELGVERTDDPDRLTDIARRLLREQFARASLGISGVNFAVAETGSVLVLENEGNIRMSTSLPRVHVAVMGIEKLLPRMADLDVFLRLLPRSGTGQKLTSYQSLITGAPRADQPADESEGPREVHVLIVDNGRSELLAGRLERQTLACIRCGACQNACPVFRQVGGHAYGSVYAGPIGAILTPQLAGVEDARELPFASSLCGACKEVCPVKIDIPRLLLHLRVRSLERAPAGKRGERAAFRSWAWAMERPWRYRALSRLARAGGRTSLAKGALGRLLRKGVGPLASWTAARELAPPAQVPFRELWERELKHEQGARDA